MANNKDFPLTSNHWGTHRVEIEDGKLKALHPFELDSDPSDIGQGIVDVIDGPMRIQQPMVRKSYWENGYGSHTERRGAEPFVAISWEQAEQLVADELQRVRRDYGNSAIFGGSYGWASAGRFHHAQSQIHRFLNCIGGYTSAKDTYSFAAAEVLIPHVLGSNLYEYLCESTSWPVIAEHTELLVAFGGIPLKNGQINAGGLGNHFQRQGITEAKAAGVQFVNISPIKSDIAEFIDAEWLAPRPNTDAAILLAIAHTLYTESLYDAQFLSRYVAGFTEFLPYLLGEHDGLPKDATWAAEISELPADAIIQLARRMAASMTMISVSWSLTRQDHGEQAFWAAITVAAMLGKIGLPGGGIGFGYSATNSIGGHYSRIKSASLPQGQNPVSEFIPVARISDMLLNPGERFDYNGKQYSYPDIKLVYWAGGNPFHHHQDLNRFRKAWQRPETIIVNEWSWNALAKHADIVLPCTVGLEREDIAIAARDPYIVHMKPVLAAAGQCRDDYDIFKGISAKISAETAANFTEGKSVQQWLRWLYDNSQTRAAEQGIDLPDYPDFIAKGWFRSANPKVGKVMLQDFRENPAVNPLSTPSGKIEIFSQTIADFGYADCPGHPVWLPPCEWLGGKSTEYPLHLISNQPETKLHSQLDHGQHSRAAKINGREPIAIHPEDAAARGLSEHDIVEVYNDRGACLAGVRLDSNLRQSVVQMSTGAWYDPVDPLMPSSLCKHGNPNVLTPDQGTSKLAQGPIAHTCLVEVRLFSEQPPMLTAYMPPEIV